MATLSDIAIQLGLSVATVSRALNPTTAYLISDPVRLKIQKLAATVGYHPHAPGRPRNSRTYTLGIVLATAFQSYFFSDYLTKVVEGVYGVLQHKTRYGCKLVVLPREKSLSEIDRHVLSHEVDGLLMATQCDFSLDEFYRMAEHLQWRSERPVVALNLPFKKGSPINVVSYDNRAAARRAVSHLIKRGRRQIGLIYADNNSEDARERIEGFKEALAARRLPFRSSLVAQGDFSTRGGYRAVKEILNSKNPCDALFCINDEMAIGAIAAIQDAGLRCPKDVAVMGFDGLAIGELTRPRLSTVAQPITEMAAAATTLLIERIESAPRKASALTVPVKLLLRDSA